MQSSAVCPTHMAPTHRSNQYPRGGGGGLTANNRTLACIRLYDYFFFPSTPLFSKNFCMSVAVEILVAAEVELLERVVGLVCAFAY